MGEKLCRLVRSFRTQTNKKSLARVNNKVTRNSIAIWQHTALSHTRTGYWLQRYKSVRQTNITEWRASSYSLALKFIQNSDSNGFESTLYRLYWLILRGGSCINAVIYTLFLFYWCRRIWLFARNEEAISIPRIWLQMNMSNWAKKLL